MVKPKTFTIGDFVFAKLRGYPPWPAIVTKNIINGKHGVVFYGSGETANVNRKDIHLYLDKKKKFVTKRAFKCSDFRLAITEIEDAMNTKTSLTVNTLNGADSVEADEPQVDSNKSGAEMSNSLEANDLPGCSDANTNLDIGPSGRLIQPAGNIEVSNSLLLVFVPPKNVVGIKLEYQKPQSFENDEKCLQWKKEARQKAEDIKEKLQLGLITLDSVKDLVVVNPSRAQLQNVDVHSFLDKLIEDEKSLVAERDFIRFSKNLRVYLGQKLSRVDRCLDILKEYKKIKLSKLMLLRNPDCVYMVRRLRNYVGNLQAWYMTAEQKTNFHIKAGIIRDEAVLIYNSFMKVFGIKPKQSFLKKFRLKVEKYNKYTEHISLEYRTTMSERTYKSIRNKYHKQQGIKKNIYVGEGSRHGEKTLPSAIATGCSSARTRDPIGCTSATTTSALL